MPKQAPFFNACAAVNPGATLSAGQLLCRQMGQLIEDFGGVYRGREIVIREISRDVRMAH
jgi:hypothetical protein